MRFHVFNNKLPAFTQREGETTTCTMLSLFVDDLLIAEPSSASMAEVSSLLLAKMAKTDLGDVSKILGIEAHNLKTLCVSRLIIWKNDEMSRLCLCEERCRGGTECL